MPDNIAPLGRRWLLFAVLVVLTFALTGCAVSSPTNMPKRVPGLEVANVSGAPVLADGCLPANGENLPVVVLVHGGSFVEGSRTDLLDLCEGVAKLGVAAFTMDYSLVPTAVYPQQLQELAAGIEWILADEQASRFGIDPARLVLVGASAGAVLAAQMAYGVEGSTFDASLLSGVVLLSGAYDYSQDAATQAPELGAQIRAYLGCASAAECGSTIASASPLNAVSSNDPATLIFHSDEEIIPAGQATALERALSEAQVPVELRLFEGGDHAEYILRNQPEAWSEFEQFLQSAFES